ncbi:hypothetical protein [Kitasatospora kifunensis]|uniref:Uncharacterized protein n=1 Tax=Kitasatospora kifunensis TaxID=58351 RepID=A0A7W7VY90_KITKI|nr:hypothetical protein [Kitasatospora kifunensis]MBB4927301.1 hypothetical protein [Kitasatospora kifunensis]
MGLRSLVIDAWGWLNYKPVMTDPRGPGWRAFPEPAATWLPEEDLRRLAAYKLLAAYDSNQAGQLAAASGDNAAVERRELGDTARLVDAALGYLLGPEQHVVVPGAEHADQAARLADATGDNRVVRQYLGLPAAGPDIPKVPLVSPASLQTRFSTKGVGSGEEV